MYYKATIEVLVKCDSEAEACDALAEGIRPMLTEFGSEQSCWIDWRYVSGPAPHSGEGFEYV